MLYDFKCGNCDSTVERSVRLKDFDVPQYCDCGTEMERQFPMQGATHGEEAAWLRTTTEFLKDGEDETIHRHPVSTRGEYKKLLKDKGLEPVG